MTRQKLADVDLSKRIANEAEYLERLEKLQKRMLRIQQAYWRGRRRAVIVFEGWDTAGKGGAIRRMTELLDPRGCKVWPIGAPTAEEQGRHYLWRFWARLPEPGAIAIFDRSWYGRVLVERVEGYAPKAVWKRAYDEINKFERMLVEDGVRIVKIFLHIDRKEQAKRFVERLTNPYKTWKMSEEDVRNRARWSDYVAAIEDMFAQTSTKRAPWHIVPANNKWYARTKVLKIATDVLGEGVDLQPPPIDRGLLKKAAKLLDMPMSAFER